PVRPQEIASLGELKKDAEGRTAFNGNRYQFFPETLTWKEARAQCVKVGGHLAVATSAKENALLTKLVLDAGRREAWIGGTDEQVEGRWEWINGATFTYKNWYAFQPNNKNNAEHYLLLYAVQGGRWCDQPNNFTDPHHPGYI